MPNGRVLIPGTCMGGLVIDGVDFMGPAWTLLDLVPLWLSARVRGTDRQIPGVDGVKPLRRRRAVTEHSLPMLVNGQCDQSGTPFANPWIGLQTNIDTLRTITDPTNATDGTRAATLTMPDGTTRTADVHVLGMTEGERTMYVLRATLDISIPVGVFV